MRSINPARLGAQTVLRCLFLLVAVLLPISGAVAQGEAEASTPTSGPIDLHWEGEQLTFDISALGGTVARCALSVGYRSYDENLGDVIPSRGFCVTLGLLSAFVNFNYEGFAFADPDTLEPIWGEKLLEDRGRSRTYETYYNRDELVAVIEKRQHEGGSRRYQRWIPENVFDILTWMQHVRTRDYAIGNTFVYYVFDGWKLRRLTMTVVRHVDFYLNEENPTIRAAEMDVDAEVLDAFPGAPWIPFSLTVPPVYLPRGGDDTRVGEAWFSLEDGRLPLGINLGTPFGKMRIRLRDIP